MKLHKFLFSILAVAVLAFSACSDYEDTVTPGESVPAGNPAVRFASTNKTAFELDPAFPMNFTLKVVREDATGALDVPITVVTNTDNSYIIPQKVSFAAGAKEATVKIEVNSTAKTDVDLPLHIKFDDQYSNMYKKEYADFYAVSQVVQWNSMGMCQWGDPWTLYSVANVELFYSPGKKQYRFANPYSAALLTEAEWDNWIGGPKSDYIIFKKSDTGAISWTFWYLGLNYQGTAGQPIKAYFPSVLSANYKAEDAQSLVSTNAAYNNKLWIFAARVYIDGLGGFGLQKSYLSLPGGPDLRPLLKLN